MTRSKSLFSIKLFTTLVGVSSVLALPALAGASSVRIAQAEETEAEEQELSPEAMEILCKNFPLNSRCAGTTQAEETAPDAEGAADTPEAMEPESEESGDPSGEMEAAPEESMEAAPEEGAEDSSDAMEGPAEGGVEQPAMEGEVSPESDPEAAPEGAITPGEAPAAPPVAPEGGVGQPEGMTPPTPDDASSTTPEQPSF